MNPEIRKNLLRNYTFNVLDGAFFGFALGFASFSAVIPLFVANMTDSAILIGLIPAIHNMGWQLPQLLLAKKVARLNRFKPTVLWMTIQERLPFLGLAIVATLLPILGTQAGLVLTFLLLIWQGLGGGFTANAWQNMISKVIPGDYRATFFGVQSAAANLLSSGGAIAAGFLLEKRPFPASYALCFIIACGLMVISWIFLNQTREPEHELPPEPAEILSVWQSVRTLLKKDRAFFWYLITRFLTQFGTMAFSFYTVFAVKRLGLGEAAVGVLVSVLMISQFASNILLGRLADHWSRKGVLELGSIFALLSVGLAWLMPSLEWFYLVMFFEGCSLSAFWSIGMAFTLEFGSDSERPTYVGMANTLIAPATILAPILGGWLADTYDYPATFSFALVVCILTSLIFHFLVRDPEKTQKGNSQTLDETPQG